MLKVDKDGCPIIINNLDITRSTIEDSSIVFDSTRNIVFPLAKNQVWKGFVQKINPDLELQWVITIDEEPFYTDYHVSGSRFHDIAFDSDSNLIFLGLSTTNTPDGDTTDKATRMTYNGIPLSSQVSNVCILALRENGTYVPDLASCGNVPSIRGSFHSSGAASEPRGQLYCKNNRVFLQAKFGAGVHLSDETIQYDYWRNSIGLFVFDYKLNNIGGFSFNTASSTTRAGAVYGHDSILYLTNQIGGEIATFGTADFDAREMTSAACVAKNVDTAFMTPYAAPTVKIEAPMHDDGFALSPNPARDILFVDAGEETIEDVNAISIYGLPVPLRQQGGQIDISCLKSGIYLLEIKTKHNKYYQKFVKF